MYWYILPDWQAAGLLDFSRVDIFPSKVSFLCLVDSRDVWVLLAASLPEMSDHTQQCTHWAWPSQAWLVSIFDPESEEVGPMRGGLSSQKKNGQGKKPSGPRHGPYLVTGLAVDIQSGQHMEVCHQRPRHQAPAPRLRDSLFLSSLAPRGLANALALFAVGYCLLGTVVTLLAHVLPSWSQFCWTSVWANFAPVINQSQSSCWTGSFPTGGGQVA